MPDQLVATIRKNSRGELRVTLSEFNGLRLVNQHVWFEAEDGTMRPGKAGVAIRVDHLDEMIESFQAARIAAECEGWL